MHTVKPHPFSVCRGGALSGTFSIATPPPFGSPAVSPLPQRETLRLCAPASQRVCPYRGAGALAHEHNRTKPQLGSASPK
jgi:hypothetical protein